MCASLSLYSYVKHAIGKIKVPELSTAETTKHEIVDQLDGVQINSARKIAIHFAGMHHAGGCNKASDLENKSVSEE